MSNLIPLMNMRDAFRIASSIFVLYCLTGCSSLPKFGPSSDAIIKEIQNENSTGVLQFEELNPEILVSSHKDTLFFSKKLLSQKPIFKSREVTSGDVISLKIWEAAEDGLFATNGKRDTSFSLKVSNTGYIDVPYAGSMHVKNKTLSQIKRSLIAKYQGKAIDPEIQVEIKGDSDITISVLGNVHSSGRVNIPSQGGYLLDIIAAVGGVSGESWENEITVIRNKKSEHLNFSNVIKYPQNNIVILPNDIIHVENKHRAFTIYGAVEKTGSIELESESPSLSDLIAKSGGLNDMQARPDAVFVFRENITEPNKVNVLRFDFSKPQTFIISKRFKLLSSDIVYVGTADASELKKFFTLFLSPIFGGAKSIKGLGN